MLHAGPLTRLGIIIALSNDPRHRAPASIKARAVFVVDGKKATKGCRLSEAARFE
jgi:hypothetical protein